MPTSTAIDARARATAQRMVAKYGRTLVLRRPVRATDSDTGSVAESPLSPSPNAAPAASIMLALSANATLGAGSISFGAGGLLGLLVAGDQIGIVGDTTVYAVTGGPYAPNGGGQLLGVAVSPVIAVAAPSGRALRVAFAGSDTTLKGVLTEVESRYIDGSLIRTGDMQVLVAQADLDAAGIAPTEGDLLFDGADVSTAAAAEILKRIPIPSGEQDATQKFIARLR
jgi:hypothetical protein